MSKTKLTMEAQSPREILSQTTRRHDLPLTTMVKESMVEARVQSVFSLLSAAFCFLLSLSLCVSLVQTLFAQVESVETGPQQVTWVSHGRIEGHLALDYSPAGAFSPDGLALAIIEKDGKVPLFDLGTGSIRRVLHPHLDRITDLDIQSANFISPTRIFMLARGLFQIKGKGVAPRTPELGFQWFVDQDNQFGKLDAVGRGEGFGPPRYFSHLGYLGMFKENHLTVWNPDSNRGGEINIPELTHLAGVFALSPDGHWLLLARIESSASPDPVVVRLSEHKFVDILRGHQATVLGMAFSPDSSRVVTACEDGKVRVWSALDWRLIETLPGHDGPVHWAEFSPDGKWIASAGEDKTVRIWSVDGGKLEQTLQESQDPLLTVAFSPTGQYLAATSEQAVVVWKKQ